MSENVSEFCHFDQREKSFLKSCEFKFGQPKLKSRDLKLFLRMHRLQEPIGGNLPAESLDLGIVQDRFAERGELNP